VWFQATKEGTYHLFCSQYCGTDHAGMTGQVIAMKPADYQKWLNYESDGSLALRGRQVFLKYRCLSCHSANAHARAPVLEGLFGKNVPLKDGSVVKADDGYIRRSILKPSDQIVAGFDDVMPPFEGQITEEEIIAASAYIQSLEAGGTPSRVEDYPPPTKTPAIKSEDIDNAK
jgi:cytochrome c oxidase subunit 2